MLSGRRLEMRGSRCESLAAVRGSLGRRRKIPERQAQAGGEPHVTNRGGGTRGLLPVVFARRPEDTGDEPPVLVVRWPPLVAVLEIRTESRATG